MRPPIHRKFCYLGIDEGESPSLDLTEDLTELYERFQREVSQALAAIAKEHENKTIGFAIEAIYRKCLDRLDVLDQIIHAIRKDGEIDECKHDRLNEEGICRACGQDCRGGGR